MKEKTFNSIQKSSGILAVLMFLATFVVTVSIRTRGNYWHIFGIGIALFFVSIFATFKLNRLAGVLLFLVTGFWVYVLVDSCFRGNGLLFNNAISHASLTKLGKVFTIFYISFMLIGLFLLTVFAFLKPRAKVFIAAPLALFAPIVMTFFHVVNYLATQLLYQDRYFATVVDRASGRIVPILTFLFGFIFLAVAMFLGNQSKKVKEKSAFVASESGELDENASVAVYSLPKMIIFTIITFGIFRIVWVKRTTEFINQYTNGRKKDPLFTALLSVFVPGYYSYFAYQASLALQGKDEKADKSINAFLPIISLVCPIITDLYIQDTINNYILGTDSAVAVDLDGAERSPIKVFLLSAITGGIYAIFRINDISKRFKNVGKPSLSPIVWGILSCIFPPISIWWAARMSKILDTYYETQKCTPFVMASTLCPPLAYALIQDRINELASK